MEEEAVGAGGSGGGGGQDEQTLSVYLRNGLQGLSMPLSLCARTRHLVGVGGGMQGETVNICWAKRLVEFCGIMIITLSVLLPRLP